MSQFYIEGKKFIQADIAHNPLQRGEYENCVFNSCNFSNSDFSEIKFIDCEFISCDLSLVKLTNTAFRGIVFKGCKMLGLRFDQCNDFGLTFSFDNCILNHSSFYKHKLKKIIFRNTQLHDVDLTECDLTMSVLDNCDMLNAKFENTIIEKADLRTAYNYTIDPEVNSIKGTKFSLAGVAGLLNKYDIKIEH